MIRADSIYHQFGGREILRDVALSLQRGEVVGLLGANGAGKTLLLRTLFGQFRPQHAFISVDGHQVRIPYRVPGLINYCPQPILCPPDLTLQRILELHGLDISEFLSRYSRFSNQLTQRMHTLPWRLLEALIVLEMPTRFTVLDEPYAGLDPLSVELVQEAIQRQRPAKGILLTDHHYEDVLATSDRNYLLTDGYLRPVADRDELFELGYLPPPLPPPPFNVDIS